MQYELTKGISNFNCDKEISIIIGADFVPTKTNKKLFEQGNSVEIFGKELEELFAKSSLNILNLEVPITERTEKLPKAGGPNLKTYPEIINILTQIKPLVMSGANNHIYDYSQCGVEDTLFYLDNNGIFHVGFGLDKISAMKTWYTEMEGIKFGIYSCSENEFCCASEERGGGNGYNPLETFDDILKSKAACDYLIVLYHGGRENYRYPSIQLKKICQKMVDVGADLVVCQHSHCIGAYEVYKDSCIVYGQGNVLFDYNDIEEWRTSILIQLVFTGNKMVINAIPLEKDCEKVRVAERDGLSIISSLRERSEKIKDNDFLKMEFHNFNSKQKNILLLRGVMGINSRLILALNKVTRGKLLQVLFQKEHKLLLENYIRCESIRESLLDILSGDYN